MTGLYGAFVVVTNMNIGSNQVAVRLSDGMVIQSDNAHRLFKEMDKYHDELFEKNADGKGYNFQKPKATTNT